LAKSDIPVSAQKSKRRPRSRLRVYGIRANAAKAIYIQERVCYGFYVVARRRRRAERALAVVRNGEIGVREELVKAAGGEMVAQKGIAA